MFSYFIENDKTWDREKFNFCLPSHIKDKILNIPIPMTGILDKIMRKFSCDGNF